MESKFRKATKEDLRNYKFKKDEPCACCPLHDRETVGSYRTTDFYLCKRCFLESVVFEEEDGK